MKNNMVKKTAKISQEQIEYLAAMLGDAYTDYLAARVLLNNRLLKQGAVLASSSLEKYLKAQLGLFGNKSHGHLNSAHWNSLKNKSNGIYRKIDKGFMELCIKCYQLRYTESIKKGFTLSIPQWRFLGELDKTAILIEESIDLKRGNTEEVLIRQYVDDKVNKNPLLWENNHVLHEKLLQEMHKGKTQFCYGILCQDDASSLIQVNYETEGIDESIDFMVPGLKAEKKPAVDWPRAPYII